MKLCIGTVQFGMDYGIQGAGQPSRDDAIDILDTAIQSGVSAIDTAAVYGSAEQVVGAFITRNYKVRDKIELISKLPANATISTVRKSLEQSHQRLMTEYLDYYLLHNTAHIYDDGIVEELFKLKQEELIRYVGASVYTPDEAKHAIARGFDVLQVPYSVFDQRMDEQGVFELAQLKSIALHARSVFTQGLMLMDEDDIPPHLEKARPIVGKLAEFCNEYGISRVQLAVSFVSRQKRISHLVFGTDNKQQLLEIIEAGKSQVSEDILAEAALLFARLDENIIMPSRWGK